MKKNERSIRKKISSLLVCMVLILAMAMAAGCKKADDKQVTTPEETSVAKVKFTFVVVDKDKNETTFEISTDKATVGEALLAENLIAGEESEYGLYVKTVNGITADYDVDQTYWAFYIDNEYAMTGVDSTPVEAGKTYSFKVEK